MVNPMHSLEQIACHLILYKNTPCVSSKQIERIAEEIDKVCTIANWEDAVAKYKV